MNYDKKRKRQNGRQTKKESHYKMYIDDCDRLYVELQKAVSDRKKTI